MSEKKIIGFRCVSATSPIWTEGEVYPAWRADRNNFFVINTHTHDKSLLSNLSSEFEPVYLSECGDDEWSDWEECPPIDHSQFYTGCVRQTETNGSKIFRTRIKRIKTVKVSELKGTVRMVDGKPDWSTYEEGES